MSARSLATAARASADALHAERLAEERGQSTPAPPPAKVTRLIPQRSTSRPNSPDPQKRRAGTRAANARRQARKDSA